MVKLIYDFFFDDGFKVGKIDYHPKFYIVLVFNWRSDYGYREFITVAMNVFAFAIIAIKRVAGFKTELLGNPDFAHRK